MFVCTSTYYPRHSFIRQNERINDNLEQQAQALFKSWFVDFEPFQDGEFVDSELGRIPKGWRVEHIGNLGLYVSDYVANGSFATLKENVTLFQEDNFAFFIRNTDLKDGSYKVFVNESSYNFLEKTRLYGGEIIISNVGDVGSVHRCPHLSKPMTLGNNVIMIKSDDKSLEDYIYMIFKWSYGKHLIEGITGGSAIPKFNKTDFKSLKIVYPSQEVIQNFGNIIRTLLQTIEFNKNKSNGLVVFRDTLLPKLMNGELKINDLDN